MLSVSWTLIGYHSAYGSVLVQESKELYQENRQKKDEVKDKKNQITALEEINEKSTQKIQQLKDELAKVQMKSKKQERTNQRLKNEVKNKKNQITALEEINKKSTQKIQQLEDENGDSAVQLVKLTNQQEATKTAFDKLCNTKLVENILVHRDLSGDVAPPENKNLSEGDMTKFLNAFNGLNSAINSQSVEWR
jgi:predicted RNase H-like nuclease (RuvC/YqgF family)